MKKRLLSILLCLVLLWSSLAAVVSAEAPAAAEGSRVEYIALSDDMYCITEITEEVSVPVERGERKTKTGTKTSSVYNGSTLLFTFSVYGVFAYDGYTATATSAEYHYTIADSAWSFGGGSASCSGATASASGTFVLNAAGDTQRVSVSLTCSPDGTLS